MEKRVTKIYFAVLLVGMIYAAFAAFSFRNNIDAGIREEAAIWDEQMETSQEDGVYYYRRLLPAENVDDKVIVYHTVHMNLEVFIDGKEVYALNGGQGRAVKTTGFCWNVISLTEEDAGREIVFQVTPVYRDGGKPEGDFYYGTYREVEHRILAERLVRLALSGLIALAGIVMLVYGLFVVKKGQDEETIVQFAIFAVMLGAWSAIETKIPDWIFPCSMTVVFLSHLLLMVMPIPFMLFLRHMYHNKENKLWSFCCYSDCAVIVVRVFLQAAGIYDLRETLLLTHISLLLFVAIIVAMTIQEIVANDFTGLVKINSICVIVILVSAILELAVFRLGGRSVPFGSIGFFIYIVVMGIVNVRRSRELMEQARESALYRKLAFTDELTGLSNRTAFREDLDKRMAPDRLTGEEKILPTVVFMFDLNDLKKCNDTFGHDYGDQYIKMAADVLKKIFTQEGRCYRIGGDEFCAWEPYISEDRINAKLRMLEQEVQAFNDKGFVVTASISVGYAIYQEGVDGGGLYSTMKRADAMMYERKQAYKRQRKNDTV